MPALAARPELRQQTPKRREAMALAQTCHSAASAIRRCSHQSASSGFVGRSQFGRAQSLGGASIGTSWSPGLMEDRVAFANAGRGGIGKRPRVRRPARHRLGGDAATSQRKNMRVNTAWRRRKCQTFQRRVRLSERTAFLNSPASESNTLASANPDQTSNPRDISC